jgi:hypothetical protein
MRRGFWFVAGAGTGVYVMIRARRAAEVFTPEGLRDRLAGLGVGAHLFADEVRTGMDARETELRQRLGLGLHGPLELQTGAEPVDALEANGGFEARFARTSTTDTTEGTY